MSAAAQSTVVQGFQAMETGAAASHSSLFNIYEAIHILSTHIYCKGLYFIALLPYLPALHIAVLPARSHLIR